MARASGCVENRSSENASCATSFSRPGGKLSTRSTRNSPVVSVPVLSSATMLMPASFSTAAPPRKRMPCRAPQAIAASTAEGMDSTSAHGDATTSSVMA